MSDLSQTLHQVTYGRGYTAEYVAEFIGRDVSFVRRCLKGTKRPSHATLILWAQAVTSDRAAYRQDKVGYPATLGRLVNAALADAAAGIARDAGPGGERRLEPTIRR
jgi:transcriptional regulator with XRE-family HTH domain